MTKTVCLCALILVTLFPASSLAEPAPRPIDELIEGSDLIVEVDVLSVAKLGTVDAPIWCARLWVHKAIKGRPPSNPMPYWFYPPTGILGELNEGVFAGQRLELYLFRDKYGYYVPWASHSIVVLKNTSKAMRRYPRKAEGGRTASRWRRCRF